MLFRHALVPFIFRFRVRRLTNWISLQSSTSLGIINTPLRTHVIGVLDNGNVALNDVLIHIGILGVEFYGVVFSRAVNVIDGSVEQVTLRRRDFTDTPIITAYIVVGDKVAVFIVNLLPLTEKSTPDSLAEKE